MGPAVRRAVQDDEYRVARSVSDCNSCLSTGTCTEILPLGTHLEGLPLVDLASGVALRVGRHSVEAFAPGARRRGDVVEVGQVVGLPIGVYDEELVIAVGCLDLAVRALCVVRGSQAEVTHVARSGFCLPPCRPTLHACCTKSHMGTHLQLGLQGGGRAGGCSGLCALLAGEACQVRGVGPRRRREEAADVGVEDAPVGAARLVPDVTRIA